MKFTNKYGLPASLCDALISDDYDFKKVPNIYSVTEIIAPPAVTVLTRRHFDEIEADTSERIWTMMGSAVHSVLEHATTKGERLREERWYLNTKTWAVHTCGNGDKTPTVQQWYNTTDIFLTGKLDCYDLETKDLQDYKITSVWAFLLDKEVKPDWVSQENMNALAVRLLGFPVEKLTIIGILKDWSKSAAKRGDYSGKFEIPFAIVDLPKWEAQYCKDFILGRIEAHQKAAKLMDDCIPACTPEERWAKPTVYAVMKEGRKTSLRNHDTKEQAELHLSQCGAGHRIDERKGTDTRCTDYCDAAPWCMYYKANYPK